MSAPPPLRILFHPAPAPGADGESIVRPPIALPVDPEPLAAWLRSRLSVTRQPSALTFRLPDLLHPGAEPDLALGADAPPAEPTRRARRPIAAPDRGRLLAALTSPDAVEDEPDLWGFDEPAPATARRPPSAPAAPRRSYLRQTAARPDDIDPFFGAAAVPYDAEEPAVEPATGPSDIAEVGVAGWWEDDPEAAAPTIGSRDDEAWGDLWDDDTVVETPSVALPEPAVRPLPPLGPSLRPAPVPEPPAATPDGFTLRRRPLLPLPPLGPTLRPDPIRVPATPDATPRPLVPPLRRPLAAPPLAAPEPPAATTPVDTFTLRPRPLPPLPPLDPTVRRPVAPPEEPMPEPDLVEEIDLDLLDSLLD